MDSDKPAMEEQRLKVLLIAYACEPDRGSEPGTGWNTALGLATRHDVTVATRANNRGLVEAALSDIEEGTRPRFLYIDPPAWTLWLKSRGIMPIQLFYFYWQREVAKRIGSSPVRYDILHQLTFNSFEIPPLVFRHAPGVKIWGPVGGGQTVPTHLLEAFGPQAARREAWRNRRVLLSAKSPWVRRTLRACDLVLFANQETRSLLGKNCTEKSTMMIDVGVDAGKFQCPAGKSSGNEVIFMAAGRLEPRKGMILAVEAFAAMAARHPDSRLRIVGDGPERARLEKAMAALGLGGKVEFPGVLSHEKMRREFETADVFVFPSLRDTSGAVVLEAMASGLPILCIAHQGVGDITEETCAIRIPPGPVPETIESLAAGMRRLAEDPDLRRQLGENARRRAVKEFSWEEKFERMLEIYKAVVGRAG